ncbi:MAG: hypothetical protein D4R70_06925 [Betaproteobacteria bacterium]|nr:MAG: hypothetical protein D4R70_06925 [Betaproteobacteria bacterium]
MSAGYNEEAYSHARQAIIDLPCAFERGLLSTCVQCHLTQKRLLAERELMTCLDAAASQRCRAFLEAVHQNARFALHIEAGQPWPFGKEIRAQCGSIHGLIEAQDAADTDIATLLNNTEAQDLEGLPWPVIMRGVVHYEPRRRRGL